MTPQERLKEIDVKSRNQGLNFDDEQYLISRILDLEAQNKKLREEMKYALAELDNLDSSDKFQKDTTPYITALCIESAREIMSEALTEGEMK